MFVNAALENVALSSGRYANGNDITVCCGSQRTCAKDGAGTKSARVCLTAINLKYKDKFRAL